MTGHAQVTAAAPLSAAARAFFRWKNEFCEVQRVQLRANGLNLRGGVADWWRTLADPLRCYLLCTVAPDDWERWMGVPWASLPEGLRSAIGIESRAVRRQLEGCSWR